ncbi:hypothetical protein BVE84_00140 [Streptococcus azizii]|uniref:Uncharacterized protein n=1 Tax=Streptococcus azizii TaxID=1579424 RepID=A0ABX3IEE7_9STRE|nr:hypothetical protein BVE84_00140 [Streptococcus azizii]
MKKMSRNGLFLQSEVALGVLLLLIGFPPFMTFLSSFILFKNQIQTTSASPCRTAVQPSASFLVCFLIFIEY